MTRTIEIAAVADLGSWTDITSKVPRDSWRCGGRAFDFESGGYGFDLDDDAAAKSFPAHRVVRFTEGATASPTILGWHRVEADNSARGTRFDGDVRKFDVSLSDRNADIRGIVVTDWSRPAEAAYVRLNALIAAWFDGSYRASTDLTNGLVSSAMSATMAKKRYHGVVAQDIVSEILQASGGLGFVTVDGQVFLRVENSITYASTISIRDDVNHNGTTVFNPEFDGEAATRDKGEALSGAVATYGSSGLVSDRRSARETAGDRWEDVIAVDATTSAAATTELAAALDGRVEDETVRCAIYLPDDKVDLIAPGQMITYRAAASKITTPTTLRIADLQWEDAGPRLYRARLELGRPTKIAKRIKTGKPPDANTPFDASDYFLWTEHWWFGTFLFECDANPAGISISSRVLTAGVTYDWSFTVDVPVGPFAGGLVGFSSVSTGEPSWNFGLNPVTQAVTLTPGHQLSSGSFIGATGEVWAHGSGSAFGHEPGHICNAEFWVDPVGFVPPPRPLPSPGQTVKGDRVVEAVDGSRTAFTATIAAAAAGYKPGSLEVWVNGVDWTNELTETDPGAGTFTLGHAPKLDSDIYLKYVAA